ncbi:MAG: phospholipid/cholesterol/gamma-HCH transport system substrate-binding protein [Solirubrobacteraceae bacterium]|jgi:virulence factor Mce-like protein|nr:phospholipid/cholesterol/gamma-HCH transport system substrate-binding protein [Solirubrobacteraceae bacterium]
METRAPTPSRIALMALFALSCFGLLLYLWSAFGGPVPLQPRGYRFYASFPEATQLAQQADVRISGVSVGKVVATKADAGSGLTRAEIRLESRYAPIPRDSRAILRLKTLLGETYVELTPGSPGAPGLPEDGELPRGNVAPTVELDEVLRTFDPSTRRALQGWVQSWARAVEGRHQDVSDALGNLAPAEEGVTSVLTVLHSQEAAVSRLVRDAGVVFGAVGRRREATQTLITAGDRVFATTAARNADLAAALFALPTFLRELRSTLAVAEGVAAQAAPVVRALRPAAPRVAPTLRALDALTPDARRLFADVDRVVTLSRRGLPAATRIVRAAPALLRVLWGVGRDLVPVVDYLGRYRYEVTTMLANVAAASQASLPGASGKQIHYLRTLIPFTNEAQADQSQRLASNRHNPYLAPRALDRLASGLQAFDCANLGNPQRVLVLGPGAPPCLVQAPFEFQGRRTSFPQVRREAP